ncbi:MAG: PQQ-binding-like beta-propeller repeat protein [Bacteroidota bacterium]|nr:PQQ-binding-like beta-propeller repeat protein [Bacteroidota bacterium]
MICLTGCRSLAPLETGRDWGDGPWQQEGGGATRRFETTEKACFPPVGKTSLSLSGSPVSGSPLVAGGLLFVPLVSEGIDIIPLDEGEHRGNLSVSGWLTCTPAIEGNHLLYAVSGHAGGVVVCFDLAKRRLVWEKATGLVEADLLVVQDTLVVATSSGELSWGSAEDTTTWFHVEFPKCSIVATAADEGTIYVLCSNGVLAAVGRTERGIRWKVHGPSPTGLLVSSDGIIVTHRKGGVCLRSLHDGRILWEKGIGGPVHAPPAADSEHVYVASADGSLSCLDIHDGRERWRYRLGGLLNAPPLVAGSHIVLAGAAGTLRAVDRENGREVWADDVMERLVSHTVLAGGKLIVCSERGGAYLFRLETRDTP